MVKRLEAKKDDVVFATSKYINIGFSDVIKILIMINEHGQSNKLAAKLRGEGHNVRVPSETVNIVKTIVANHPEMSQHPIGKKILRPTAKKASRNGALMAAPVNDRECCGFGPGG